MKFFGRGILRRHWRRLLVGLVLMPFLIWGGMNLFFLTPFGRGLIEDQIATQLRVDCEIDGLSWSPWAGVTVSGVRLFPPENCGQEGELLEVDQISVDLSWLSLMERKLRWERLEITGVRIDLSIEALRDVLARYEIPKPEAEDKGGEERLAQGDPPKPKEQPKAPKDVVAEDKPSDQARDVGKEPATKDKSKEDFEGVLIFSEVDVRFFSVKSPHLAVAIKGIKGEIPLWGSERKGSLSLESLALGDDLQEEGKSLQLNLRDQTVAVDSGMLKIFGLDCRVRGMLRMVPGYPFGVQVDVPSQDIDFSPVYQSRHSPLAFKGLVSKSVLQGYLKAPAAFRGTHFSVFEEAVFHDLSDGGETRFERGRLEVSASAAGVVARDVRAIGDDDAILMNGFVTFGGEAAATVRIVSSPGRADSHEQRVKKANSDWTLGFEPLITPDRRYRDLRLEWREGRVMVDLAKNQGWVPFWHATQQVLGRRNTTFRMKP